MRNIGNQIIVLFSLDAQRYALNLSTVEHVVPIVEITPLPKSPEIVMGVINFHGEIIQVINIRKRFNLPVREIELDDQLIVVRTSKQLIAIVVDSVTGIHELEYCQLTGSGEALPCSDYLSGVVMVENDIVLILNEQRVMDEALYA